MVDLIGAWSLVSSVQYRDGVPKATYGAPPSGQIQYTADRRMSAFLMRPEWAAAGVAEADPFDDFFAYAGRWTLEGDTVHHDIEFCTTPALVGARFTRFIKLLEDGSIELTTAKETSRSGAERFTILRWRRHQS